VGQIVNLTAAAEVLGVVPETVRRWIVGGAPCISKPGPNAAHGYKIDLAALIDWRITQERERALKEVGSIDVDEARRRKLAAEAGIAEHELAIKQGSAVAIEDAVQALDNAIGSCRSRLLGLGSKLGPQVAIEKDAANCQALIDAAVRDTLTELAELEISHDASRGESAKSENPKKPRAVGAAAKTQRKRVGGSKKKAQSRGKRRAGPVGHRKG